MLASCRGGGIAVFYVYAIRAQWPPIQKRYCVLFGSFLVPANRFSGCSTCRRRKVKCGEERPICRRCSTLHLSCVWGIPVKRGRSTQIRSLEPAPVASESYPTCPLPKAEDLAEFQPDAFLPSLSPTSWASDVLPLNTVHTRLFQPAAPIPYPIYPSLNTDNIACANSLALNSFDRQYFQYFPSSSLVYYYMKCWKWSSFWSVSSSRERRLRFTSALPTFHPADQISFEIPVISIKAPPHLIKSSCE